ncbi:MAG: hypothetical protein NXI27_28025 [Alphaproteobacteria bacterium]|nr:hypothetical protein [Alphaproteobacteria bacterium]
MNPALVTFGAGIAAGLLTISAYAGTQKGSRLCPQSLAGYGTESQDILLEFAGSADGAFRVLLGNGGGVLQGFVYPGEENDDNLAVVLNDCPEGDATGEELAACTIWQGPIVAVAENGDVAPMPASDQPAAETLLLEGFSDALMASDIYNQAGLSAGDFDTLRLMACQE